jgi:hypothetical protein
VVVAKGFGFLLALAASVLTAGCGGGGANVNTPPPCSTYTMSFPAVAGIAASATVNAYSDQYNPPDCIVGPFATQASTTPIDAAYVPAQANGKTLLYLAFTSPAYQDILGWPGVSITVPAALIVPGRTFWMADNYYGFASSWLAAQGPLTVRGTTLSAPVQANDDWYLDAGADFDLALYEVGP